MRLVLLLLVPALVGLLFGVAYLADLLGSRDYYVYCGAESGCLTISALLSLLQVFAVAFAAATFLVYVIWGALMAVYAFMSNC